MSRVKVEIAIYKDRWPYGCTNFNSMAGFEIPFSVFIAIAKSTNSYVVLIVPSQFWRPAGSSRLVDESPKNIYGKNLLRLNFFYFNHIRNIVEFGTSQNAKALGYGGFIVLYVVCKSMGRVQRVYDRKCSIFGSNHQRLVY